VNDQPIRTKVAPLKIGLPLKVLLWFAHDPEDKLTTSEISEMFDQPTGQVACSLRYARVNGLLEAKWALKMKGVYAEKIWTAGPTLLEIIGHEVS
jgi:hypothetical protein